MPLYRYECNHCKNEWKEWLDFDAEPVEECPSCLSNDIKRLVPGVVKINKVGKKEVGSEVKKAIEENKEINKSIIEKQKANRDKIEKELGLF